MRVFYDTIYSSNSFAGWGILKWRLKKQQLCDSADVWMSWGGGLADQRPDRIQKQGCGIQVSMQTWAISQALGTAGDVPRVNFAPTQPSKMAFIGEFLAWMFEF